MGQRVIIASEEYAELDDYFNENSIKAILLVCDNAFPLLRISKYFDTLDSRLGIKVVRFNRFQPNPLYESVTEGVEVFHRHYCDSIIAVGGGSAIDVAKCIKLYCNMDPKENYLKQKIVPNDVKLLAMPTTAGTGSEATRYAVIYFDGEKQSISDESCIPFTVLMDTSVLRTLPEYQKKATMMDAFCHAIESFWSVNSTEESRAYSQKAIQMILSNKDLYLSNDETGNASMLWAANTAGKAINITQTTAGHAMCYKLTSLYGIAHGYAAALCVSKLWPYMITHTDRCIDPRGEGYLKSVFTEIADTMGYKTVRDAVLGFQCICDEFALSAPIPRKEDYDILRKSVNLVRLKNNPVALDADAINTIYHQILEK